jgi:hypothetical protein
MTRALVDVARYGQRDLTETELDIAQLARRDVVELLTTVQADLTGHRTTRGVTRIDDLETDPVAALGTALARYARPPSAYAPSDAFVLPATTPSGQAWREAGRHALLAHHHWTGGPPATLDESTTWTGVADLAAIARQLVALDRELADVLATAGGSRTTAAADIARAATSGLGVAARETSRLAAASALACAGPERSAAPAPARRVVTARRAADLPVVQRRLAEFLDGAANLRPERLPHLATAIAQCALVAGDQVCPDTETGRALRGELREQARLLREATTRPGGLVSLEPGDLLPLRQAAEAYQGARRHASGLRADPRLLDEYVGAIAATSRALTSAVDRSIAGGQWLVPDRTESLIEPSWTTLRPTAPAPYPVLALRAAASHTAVLDSARSAWSAPPSSTLARDFGAQPHTAALQGASAPREVVVELAPRRPRLPSQPVTALAARARRR